MSRSDNIIIATLSLVGCFIALTFAKKNRDLNTLKMVSDLAQETGQTIEYKSDCGMTVQGIKLNDHQEFKVIPHQNKMVYTQSKQISSNKNVKKLCWDQVKNSIENPQTRIMLDIFLNEKI